MPTAAAVVIPFYRLQSSGNLTLLLMLTAVGLHQLPEVDSSFSQWNDPRWRSQEQASPARQAARQASNVRSSTAKEAQDPSGRPVAAAARGVGSNRLAKSPAVQQIEETGQAARNAPPAQAARHAAHKVQKTAAPVVKVT